MDRLTVVRILSQLIGVFASFCQCPQFECVSSNARMCSELLLSHVSLFLKLILFWTMYQLPIRPKRRHDTNLVMNWLSVGLHVLEYPPSFPKPCVCHKESVQSRT